MSSRKRSLPNRAYSRIAAVGACLLLALAGACSRENAGVRRIAVLPFENLSADARLGWAGRAFAEVLRSQFLGSPDAQPYFVSTLRDVPGAHADAVLHGYFYLSGGKLKVEAVLENTRSHRTVATASAAGAPGAILPLADAIARQIEPHARAYSGANEAALRAYTAALEASEPDAAAREFARAVEAGPAYGAAYAAWAQWMISHGRPALAQPAIAAARAQWTALAPVERAQLQTISAALSGDPAAERKALLELARATPADPSVYRGLAGLDLRARACPSAIGWYERALAIDPDDIVLLNETGYAQACARDLESATRTLSRYRDLRPNEANPLDSLGDVNFQLGRFSAAARYYSEAYSKDPAFLLHSEMYKTAWAYLMAGDLPRANEAFGKFLETRQAAHDPVAPYREAQWEFLTGRRKQALSRMEALTQAPQPLLAALATRELSAWRLELSGKLENAIEPLQARRDRTSPTTPDWSGVILARALAEKGRWPEASEILATNPLPNPLHDDPFLSLGFPRIFFLRAEALARQGRRDEAKANYRLFLQYAGDLPSASGEQQRAKEALAKL